MSSSDHNLRRIMTENEAEDEYETVYEVYSAIQYGFGGDDSLWVAVTQETEDQIIGRKYSPLYTRPGERIVINKSNVAGWSVDENRWRELVTNE